jgi:hypothetical protein
LSATDDHAVCEVNLADVDSAVRGAYESGSVLAALGCLVGFRSILSRLDYAAGAMLHWGARGFNSHASLSLERADTSSASNDSNPFHLQLVSFLLNVFERRGNGTARETQPD